MAFTKEREFGEQTLSGVCQGEDAITATSVLSDCVQAGSRPKSSCRQESPAAGADRLVVRALEHDLVIATEACASETAVPQRVELAPRLVMAAAVAFDLNEFARPVTCQYGPQPAWK